MNLKNLLIQLHQKPIAVYPIYRKITGSLTASILLSQILYWWSAVGGRKFYKTDLEIMNETLLTANELRGAKLKLKKLDFILITREGLPAKTFYDFEIVNFTNKISEISENKFSGINSSYNIVHKNTTESNTPQVKEKQSFSAQITQTEKDELKAKPKRKKTPAAKKEKPVKKWMPDFFKSFRDVYKEIFNTPYAAPSRSHRGKDAKSFEAIRKSLIETFTDRQKRQPSDGEVLNAFDWLLKQAAKDAWILERFEPSIIKMKYNGIITKSTRIASTAKQASSADYYEQIARAANDYDKDDDLYFLRD